MLRYLIVFISFIVISPAAHASRLALVIGNNDYIYESSLNSPVNDAKDMATVLRGLGFTVIDKYNLKQRDFDRAVQSFENQLHKYHVGLFYFSGHGLQARGDNYLVPIDARIKSAVDIKYVSINANQILEKMEYANKHTNLLILDACRSNPFKSIHKGFSQGLAEMSPRGSLIAFATAPGTTALDGLSTERNSIYTKHLLKQLRTQAHLSVSDLLTQVAGGVMKETNQKQWPWKSDSLTDVFYFAQAVSSQPKVKPERVPYLSSDIKNDWAMKWDGLWTHTEVIVGGTFSGAMLLDVKRSRNGYIVSGNSENSQGGSSILKGYLINNGKTYIGNWKNPITGKSGTFNLQLLTPNYFEGNYALEDKPIEKNTNKWSGYR